ncbi:MAG: formamidopyrimidine-DNA glycosylase [Planctomycetes bacterium]|nr:formamidopyrimidine-DNA glycosylase [Planctomycetota bacterium]
MPELPDILVYRDCLTQRLLNTTINSLLIRFPFLLRTFDPPPDAVESHRITDVSTLGKRIVISCDNHISLVIHLMIAGRFRFIDSSAKTGLPSKIELARLRTTAGTLILTEASQKKRASLHILPTASLSTLDPGGLDPLTSTPDQLIAALRTPNRTIKRALTDPHTIRGIGNAYSDEVLHAAKLSPITHTSRLTPDEWSRLAHAIPSTLNLWIARLQSEFAHTFPGPGDITAFRPDFAVHGKFGKPCPVCQTKVQRIVRAENEFNYCPTCQTGGKILADRSLSRLLGDDWPRTPEEWDDFDTPRPSTQP